MPRSFWLTSNNAPPGSLVYALDNNRDPIYACIAHWIDTYRALVSVIYDCTAGGGYGGNIDSDAMVRVITMAELKCAAYQGFPPIEFLSCNDQPHPFDQSAIADLWHATAAGYRVGPEGLDIADMRSFLAKARPRHPLCEDDPDGLHF